MAALAMRLGFPMTRLKRSLRHAAPRCLARRERPTLATGQNLIPLHLVERNYASLLIAAYAYSTRARGQFDQNDQATPTPVAGREPLLVPLAMLALTTRLVSSR